jgi:hypothetical protein
MFVIFLGGFTVTITPSMVLKLRGKHECKFKVTSAGNPSNEM